MRDSGDRGGRRRGREPEPGGRADGDGGELSRLGVALARRGAAGRPLRAHAPARGGGDRAPTLLAGASCRRCARLPGVARVAARCASRALLLDPARPAVTLIARPLGDPARSAAAGRRARCRRRPGEIGVYVSEAMVDLYGARPGTRFAAAGRAFGAARQRVLRGRRLARLRAPVRRHRDRRARLRAPHRRPPRQRPGAVAGAGRDARRRCRQALRALAARAGTRELVEFASAREMRATSLRIFDRSFAVTYWLQAVAIAIGLFGIAASFSAQVLARRKEFGLLAHLGFTRAPDPRAWSPAKARPGPAVGAVAGLALGLAVAWCWCTWSTRRASTGPWTCCCPGGGWPRCAPRWWPPAPSPPGWRRAPRRPRGRAGGEGRLVGCASPPGLLSFPSCRQSSNCKPASPRSKPSGRSSAMRSSMRRSPACAPGWPRWPRPPRRPDRRCSQVTILFLDVVGSTTLSQHLDPEETHAVMDGALARFSRHRRGASAARCCSTPATTCWPSSAPTKSARTTPSAPCAAAWRCSRKGGAQRRESSASTATAASTCASACTPAACCSAVASMPKAASAASPSTSPRAWSRPRRPAALRISHDTYRHVRGVFDVEPQPPMAVKGVDEPIATYLVLRAKPRAFRVATRGIEGVETRMVGRDAELEQLQTAFQRLSQRAQAERRHRRRRGRHRQEPAALRVRELGRGAARGASASSRAAPTRRPEPALRSAARHPGLAAADRRQRQHGGRQAARSSRASCRCSQPTTAPTWPRPTPTCWAT